MTNKSKTIGMTRAVTKTAARRKKVPKTTTAKLVWRDVTCRVTCTPNYISKGWTHIELIVVTPKGAPLPITATGYLSHFLDADELKRSGGPVTFFTAWIEREAKSKAWAKTEFAWRQMTFAFDA